MRAEERAKSVLASMHSRITAYGRGYLVVVIVRWREEVASFSQWCSGAHSGMRELIAATVRARVALE